MDSSDTVLFKVDRGVGVVTFNRPEKHNAFNDEMSAAMGSTIELASWLIGTQLVLPAALFEQYPELSNAVWREGGIVLRLGGWCLGRATVSGITLGRTVWLAKTASLEPELLLHEVRHVHQFATDPLFPLRYIWRSLRFGYRNNPYEADARSFAARRLASAHPTA